MKAIMHGLAIKGICACLPKKVFEVSSLGSVYGEKKIKRIISSTGVERVHIADEKTTASDLCIKAAERLLERLGIAKDSIDGVVFVSFSPDYRAPATSAIMQDKLGLNENVVCFDINYGCSAYIYGLYQAGLLIRAGGCKRVLVCCGDVQSKLFNEKDRSLKVILGDAGSATIVEMGEDTANFIIKTDGSGHKALIIPAGGTRMPYSSEALQENEDEDGNIRSLNNLYMDGMQVMSFALKQVPVIIEDVLEAANWRKEDVGTYALHQPNKLILDYLRDSLGVQEESFPIVLQNNGNTAAASIPLLLAREHRRLKEEERLHKVVACGFGIGLSWGAVTLDLSATEIMDVVEY